MSSKDNLGDRIKNYERLETDQFLMPMLPTIVRLDGRSFSKFTKSFDPFDISMSESMEETTKYLVKQSNALLGYTQSDEITLILYSENTRSQVLFNGKKHKLLSNMASMASVKFYYELSKRTGNDYADNLPSFDCRLYQVPTKMEAWNSVLWRVQDCIKNSVAMLSQQFFSHKQLQGKNQNEQLAMLFHHGVRWSDLPKRFKEGIFVRKIYYDKVIDISGTTVTRSRVDSFDSNMNFNQISNRIEYLFDGDQAVLNED